MPPASEPSRSSTSRNSGPATASTGPPCSSSSTPSRSPTRSPWSMPRTVRLLTGRQRAVLVHLADGGDHALVDVAAAFEISTRSAARTLDSLVHRGHLRHLAGATTRPRQYRITAGPAPSPRPPPTSASTPRLRTTPSSRSCSSPTAYPPLRATTPTRCAAASRASHEPRAARRRDGAHRGRRPPHRRPRLPRGRALRRLPDSPRHRGVPRAPRRAHLRERLDPLDRLGARHLWDAVPVDPALLRHIGGD